MPPLTRWPALALVGLVRGYRFWFQPWLGNVCRYEPSCSSYTMQALQQHGAVKGSALAGWRILRCNPWCLGGCDPVPDDWRQPAAGLFTRLGLPLSADAADDSSVQAAEARPGSDRQGGAG